MAGKTYYDILGVGPSATTAEIRSAYVLRSKVMHPDRFDQAKQPQEWKLANELLQELNQANATLRDPTLRRRYDESVFGRSAAPPPPPPPRPTPRPAPPQAKRTDTKKFNVPEDEIPKARPRSQLWMPNVFRGSFRYRDQPKSVKILLKQRSNDKVRDQIRVPYEDNHPAGSVIVLGFSVFCLYLTALPGTRPWSGWGYIGIFLWCLILGTIGAGALDRLIKYIVNPVRSWVIVTPLYLVLMDYDEITAWPLWEVTSVKSTGGEKFKVLVEVGPQGHTVSFTLPNAAAYTQFYNFIKLQNERLQAARIAREIRYFDSTNDLVAAVPTRTGITPYVSPFPTKTLYNLCTAAVLGLFVYAAMKSPATHAATPPRIIPPAPVEVSQPAPTPPPPVAPPPPIDPYPPQAASPDGAVFTYSTFGDPSAFCEIQLPGPTDSPGPSYPFPVKAADSSITTEMRPSICPFTINAPAGENYFIKLIDAVSGHPVMGYFVSAGESVTVKVPLGTYSVHCASGQVWYGMDHLFGHATGYSKLDDTFTFTEDATSYTTETVTLYPVTNGNLHTSDLNPKDF